MIVLALENDGLLDEHMHENISEYWHQVILTVEIDAYARRVPSFIDKEWQYNFITAYPSRTATKKYL